MVQDQVVPPLPQEIIVHPPPPVFIIPPPSPVAAPSIQQLPQAQQVIHFHTPDVQLAQQEAQAVV